MQAFRQLAPLALAISAMSPAHADVSLLDSSMYAAIAGSNNATVGAVTFSSAAGNFITKTVFGSSGLGITGGRTSDEIDVGETATMTWTSGLIIKNFSVSVLFNGPEYADWAEIAQVKAWNGATLVGTGQLQVAAVANNVAAFTGTGFGSVTNLSLADSTHGGAWQVSDPFGNAGVTKLEFTALNSALCGTPTCSNQSDFTLSSVAAVPEPETYALMMAGLAVVGFVARRRRPIDR